MVNLFYWVLLLLSGISFIHCVCQHGPSHCQHFCQSSGKYNCVTTSGHMENHGCECLPKDYCDYRYSCSSTDVACSHNEAIRCNGNNKCECYCSQDSQCLNCPAGNLGFCVNEKCVCETNNYCPGNNKFYCLKNFQCAHSESKRCNQNDRCECFCDINTDCKNCPEKGFCVDGSCVCESQNYCPKGNHMYCLSLSCDRGYTSKCNSTNHCYCAYVPDTCSNHDVSKCYHLTCSSGEKKYCDGRTCTCKPLDYCQQNDGDCQHKTCDASKGEVKVCLSGTCGCLAIPDFCGGDDTSTCQHIICNQYQVKKCENGMCKCQVNPSCSTKEGLNDTCTPENTYLEVKGSDGKTYYANCTDSFHYPLCVEDRCQCVYWKTPPPNLTSEGSTIPTNSMTDVAGSSVSSPVTSQTTDAMTDSSTPISTDQPTGASQATDQTTDSILNTTKAPTTISVATCATRIDCNQQNTHLTFPTFTMPCPEDHIDCVDNKCFCSLDKITTTTPQPTATAAPSISCHQCGDPDANLPCDLRTVYMGQPSQCSTGSYCMTDVVQGSDDSVAIYKRCVDELTCRNEWMAQSSDQDRCLRYAEGAVPGQYTCHYCCTVDGCNSNIVPEARTFYSTSSSINN
ncbi:protein kinase C-binding protein NELL2-like isoform X2 [Crassostrea angulata]|uniref:protein kinase C-binding protein NELL2-like isoform X2 n=1 Tax=Magallana angulata TaxID=2784310 RepID=UPI0022B1FF36|nr:protein kinase C-binding protein NELL2-like isoform X2 [Crassostrea angulata]